MGFHLQAEAEQRTNSAAALDGSSAAAAGGEIDRSVQLSCGEHTDYGLLTLVNQDPGIAALQVISSRVGFRLISFTLMSSSLGCSKHTDCGLLALADQDTVIQHCRWNKHWRLFLARLHDAFKPLGSPALI